MTVYYENERSLGPLHKVLIWHLHDLHRPEIADWIEGCSFFATSAVLLVEPQSPNTAGMKLLSRTHWLEKLLLQVVFQAGLPFDNVEITPVGESSCYSNWTIWQAGVANPVH